MSLIQYPFLVREDAGNKPNAATAYDCGGSADTGHRTFAAVMANGERCFVKAEQVDGSGNPAGAWEIHLCTFTDAATDTLSKDTLYASSTGSAIDWSAATGIDKTPKLSIVDPNVGMGRFVDEWVYSSDVASVSFDWTPKANTVYRFVMSHMTFNGNVSTVDPAIRFKRSGTADTGASDYGYAQHGYTAGSVRVNGANDSHIALLHQTLYGDDHTGWDTRDRLYGFIDVYDGANTSHYTRAVYLGTSPFTNVLSGLVGVATAGGVHQFAAAIDGIVFLDISGQNITGGRIEMYELYGKGA